MNSNLKNLIFSAVLYLFAASLFASVQGDTTFTINLNLIKNKPAETIVLDFNDSTMAYTLKIGSAKIDGKFEEAFTIQIDAIDIDKNSENKILAIQGIGNDDYMVCNFYQFLNNKFIPCGHIDYSTGLSSDGDKILKSNSWMGFWTLTEEYFFDASSMTLQKKPKDTYPVADVSGKVTKSFSLKKNRSDNSESAGTLKAGTKIKITKADISPSCKNENGDDNSFNCYWYYFKASDGTEGWCRMKDFQQNVEGLPWAG